MSENNENQPSKPIEKRPIVTKSVLVQDSKRPPQNTQLRKSVLNSVPLRFSKDKTKK